jgi:hypothetical protein
LFAASETAMTKLGNVDVPPAEGDQFWGLDRAKGTWAFDLMIEPGDPSTWGYKRDPSFTAPRSVMIHRTRDGIPYLRAAAILLFKAKHRRPKDELDFDQALPKLNDTDRRWLDAGLRRFHPGHPWTDRL